LLFIFVFSSWCRCIWISLNNLSPCIWSINPNTILWTKPVISNNVKIDEHIIYIHSISISISISYKEYLRWLNILDPVSNAKKKSVRRRRSKTWVVTFWVNIFIRSCPSLRSERQHSSLQIPLVYLWRVGLELDDWKI
jgi:hypothetical protein